MITSIQFIITSISPFFQRQWNHSSDSAISTLLWRFHVSIGFICLHNSNRKWCFGIKDCRDPVQLCRFCHTTSVLPKWRCQFQKQSSTTRLVESFETRAFSEKYQNSTNCPMRKNDSNWCKQNDEVNAVSWLKRKAVMMNKIIILFFNLNKMLNYVLQLGKGSIKLYQDGIYF